LYFSSEMFAPREYKNNVRNAHIQLVPETDFLEQT
jgi:hypothetical protein